VRSIVIAAIIGASFALTAAQARAVTEFCPASLAIKAVGTTTQNQPATLYGVMLRAPGPRAVTATLAFDTDHGWFAATIPPVTLTGKTYRYRDAIRTATRSDWISPVMYVRFPSSTKIANSWISNANALPCAPSPPTPNGASGPRFGYRIDPANEDKLDAAPTSNSVVVLTQKIAPLYQPVCANPFRDGRLVEQGSLNLSEDMQNHGLSGETDVEVSINKDGTLADAWVWLSSGEAALDNAALWAAQHSTYEGAMAYCEPVPANYLFKITFG
jgi:TonB family protein